MALYYSNGGPGPASRLRRIDAPDDGDFDTWYRAQGWKWTVRGGWEKDDHVQGEVTQTGEFGMIDESEVEKVMQEMRDRSARFP